MTDRCLKGFAHQLKLAEQDGCCCVLFVVHGGSIMAILERYALPQRPFYDFQVENGQGWQLDLSLQGENGQSPGRCPGAARRSVYNRQEEPKNEDDPFADSGGPARSADWGPCVHPHPIRGIGWLISSMEKLLRRLFTDDQHRRALLAGGVLAAVVPVSVFLLTFGLIWLAAAIHPLLGFCVEVLLGSLTLAARSLKIESMKVYHQLAKGTFRQPATPFR